MVTPVALVTGLGGAIGCDYRRSHSELIFVEFAGNLSRLDLIRSLNSIVSSGAGILHGTFLFDFDTGTEGSGDVWWEQVDATVRQMVPQGTAQIVNIGVVDFNSVTPTSLQGLAYSTTPIDGNNDASNQLVNGDVFAVLTNGGNFAKVQVLNYGYDLAIQWVTYQLNPAYQVLGTGYTQPEDVVLSGDDIHAYITERSGDLVFVDLSNANRSAATLISSGMTAPHQMVLDEAHGYVYLVEFANPGRLLRINLSDGTQTAIVSNLQNAIGLLMTADGQYAYVTEQLSTGTGQLVRINLSTAQRQVLFASTTAPLFFLTWTDASQGAILTTERDPANEVWLIDLTQSPVSASAVAMAVPFRPSSVAVVSSDRLLLCSDSEISELDLTGSVYVPTGPIFQGVGNIPENRVNANTADPRYGYADTTVDPNYFFQVQDAPFGATLPIVFNYPRAFSDGAQYYSVLVDGAAVLQTWYDYRWDDVINSYVLTAVSPLPGGYYSVRPPGERELWFHDQWGYLLDTSGLSNDLHTISIQLFSAPNPASEIGSIGDPGRSLTLRIDNRYPTAIIDSIQHDGTSVDTCGIVSSGSDAFNFQITATHPGGALSSWSLSALWGDNQSASIGSDVYNNHLATAPIWSEPNLTVPALPSAWHATVAGDPTSTHCAHTFSLLVWDRVTNGLGPVHGPVGYNKSITIIL